MKALLRNLSFQLTLIITFFSFGCQEEGTTTPEVKPNAPTATFTVVPESGTTETTFIFDASGCSDQEDDVSKLEVRWDWENDGKWDTGYSRNKIATHQFSYTDSYTVKLEVKDSDGSLNSNTKTILVEGTKYGTVTDIDGNVYKTIQIRNQWWMAENLKVTHYRNGDEIPNVTNILEWSDLYVDSEKSEKFPR